MIDFKKNNDLADILSAYMDGNEDLKTLAMAMRESPGSLVSDNKSPKVNAQNLSLFMDRRGRFDELLNTTNVLNSLIHKFILHLKLDIYLTIVVFWPFLYGNKSFITHLLPEFLCYVWAEGMQ